MSDDDSRFDSRRVAAVLLALAVAFCAGFLLARLVLPGAGEPVAGARSPALPPPDAGEGDRIAALRQELEIATTRSEVDRAALEILRRDFAGQKETLSDLAEGLRFYRSLMTPDAVEQGLSLRPLELVATAENRRFAFRIVVQQKARQHRSLVGSLRVEVYGERGGEMVSYSLADLTETLEHHAVPLRFRYFQTVEGVLELPDGFQPQGMDVVAVASKPTKMRIDARYLWQVRERFVPRAL